MRSALHFPILPNMIWLTTIDGTKKKHGLGTMNVMFDVHYDVTFLGLALSLTAPSAPWGGGGVRGGGGVLERNLLDTNHVLSAIRQLSRRNIARRGSGVTLQTSITKISKSFLSYPSNFLRVYAMRLLFAIDSPAKTHMRPPVRMADTRSSSPRHTHIGRVRACERGCWGSRYVYDRKECKAKSRTQRLQGIQNASIEIGFDFFLSPSRTAA